MRDFLKTIRKHGLLSLLVFMTFLIGGYVYAKANFTEVEFDYEGLRYFITYNEMGEIEKEAVLTQPYDSLNRTYENYTGDIIIPDSVPCDGKMHPVVEIRALFDSVSSLRIPNTVTYVGKFFGCVGLDSINLPTPMWIDTYSFYMSYIRKFVFRENPDGPEGVIVDIAGGGFWSQCENVCIDIAPVQKIRVCDSKMCSLCPQTLYIHHADTLQLHNAFLPDNTILDDYEPPYVIFEWWNPDSVSYQLEGRLFVPDGSEELYANAPLWRNFPEIYPKSRLGEFGIEPSGIKEVTVPSPECLEVKVSDNLVEIHGLTDGKCMVHDLNGRTVKILRTNESTLQVTLPPGIYILSSGGRSAKVAVSNN